MRSAVVTVLGAFLLCASAGPAVCQADTTDATPPALTLRGWARTTWYRIADRYGAPDGRLSELGILQRFNRLTDDELVLDFISDGFRHAQDSEWEGRANGVRYWAGSINKRDVITAAEFKTDVSLGARWSFRGRLTRESAPDSRRTVFEVTVEHRWPSGIAAFAGTILDPQKSDSDIEVGVGWRPRSRGAPTVSASVALLDAFNDVIYQGIGVCACYADTAIDHERQPFAGRLAVEVPLGRRARAEVHGALMLPTRIRAYAQVQPDSGFRQWERFGYAGAVVEGRIAAAVAVGSFAKMVRASLDRDPLVPPTLSEDFERREAESQVGWYVLGTIRNDWTLEGWIARHWRTEYYVPESEPTTVEAIDYADEAWIGQLLIGHTPQRGLQGTLALEFDLRSAVRGEGDLPLDYPIAARNTRLNTVVGWRLPNAVLELGVGWDLDGDYVGRANRIYDGAKGRFVVYW